jgi:hypothetical protein
MGTSSSNSYVMGWRIPHAAVAASEPFAALVKERVLTA